MQERRMAGVRVPAIVQESGKLCPIRQNREMTASSRPRTHFHVSRNVEVGPAAGSCAGFLGLLFLNRFLPGSVEARANKPATINTRSDTKEAAGRSPSDRRSRRGSPDRAPRPKCRTKQYNRGS